MKDPRTRLDNVSDFLLQAAGIQREWFEDEKWAPWYRGQKRAEWGLLPSLYRNCGGYAEIWEDRVEDEIREEFIIRAPIFSEVKPAGEDDWEWYFLMQHFGAPTRLLDWTEGALVALYFAVKDNPGYYDAAVWALDPFKLNKRAIGREEVIPPSAQGVLVRDRRLVKPWLPMRFAEKALPQKPIAVFPTHIARRISTQRSCFTVHGSDEAGLDRLEKSKNARLRRMVIPSFRVEAIRQELIDAGIDEATIFPDLDGLGRAVGSNWRSGASRYPHSGVLTRLGPSRTYPGKVGVFAITRIARGHRLFAGENEEILWLDRKALSEEHMSKPARALYKEFGVRREDRLGCPTSFNRLTLAWYLKPPKSGSNANVLCDEYYEFVASRNIRAGEELLADFRSSKRERR